MKHRELIPAVLVIIAFIAGAMQSKFFLDFRYLLDSSTLYVETGLLALAMTFVIVSGNIDLSVASTLALVAVVAARLWELGWSSPMVFAAALALGALCGAINGMLVAYAGIPSFMVTIGTLALYRGVAQAIVGAESAKVPTPLIGIDMVYVPETSIPASTAGMLLLGIVAGLVLSKSVFGHWVRSIGTNERASFFSGVPTAQVKLAVFTLAGVLSAVAALHIDSRLGVGRFDHAAGLEVDVITAVVLGGTSIYGGRGSILGTMLALLLVALIRTGMGVANVKAEYQLAIVGTLLVLTIVATNIVDRISDRAKSR
ncbi:MAG TPA: ABC transporter permease [Fimbriimonas sp.]|nr:ABC transporter permease [Fimbriimonas sp.]